MVNVHAAEDLSQRHHSWPIPLCYNAVEQLYRKKCRKCTRLLNESLVFGSERRIKSPDIDEAIRGLSLPYRGIKQHALGVLTEPKLRNQDRVLPAIAKLFGDKDASTRSLAIFAISFWKSRARPFATEVRALTRDKNPDVREQARMTIRRL